MQWRRSSDLSAIRPAPHPRSGSPACLESGPATAAKDEYEAPHDKRIVADASGTCQAAGAKLLDDLRLSRWRYIAMQTAGSGSQQLSRSGGRAATGRRVGLLGQGADLLGQRVDLLR